MGLGILQRYVIGEVLRAFVMAVLTMTIIFVLFMVMAEATKLGLSPRDILALVPFIIPSTLPYTVPVSMLFAVTVVYGRLASDNEIVAVKTAGLSAWTVLLPTILMGAVLSGGLLFLSSTAIPRATHNARMAIFKNLEEMFYKLLKKDREFNNPSWPFLIKVRDVQDKTMLQATFKHRSKGGPDPFDMVVSAKKAVLNFDFKRGVARVYLDGAEVWGGKQDDIVIINDREFEMELPEKNSPGFEKRIQEWTSAELVQEQAKFRQKLATERKRQAIRASFEFASGRTDRIVWPDVTEAFREYGYWTRKLYEYETEKQLRVAQSFGTLLFVLLGAPVGIRFAKRDFLSAFITCFVPIILAYYPLMLLGVNIGKENIVDPTIALWAGNLCLFSLACMSIRPVLRH
ncbi:MAG: LptF/LptG family permease [Isosphaeraceae bacterium]